MNKARSHKALSCAQRKVAGNRAKGPVSATKQLFFQLSRKTAKTIQFFREQLKAEEYTSYEVETRRDGDVLVHVVKLKTFATSVQEYPPAVYICRFTYNYSTDKLTLHAGDARSELVCFPKPDVYLENLSSSIRYQIKSIMGVIKNKLKK